MKVEIDEKRDETAYAPYVEHYENLAYKMWNQIKFKYKKRCIEQGAPLGYMGEKRIREYFVEKMFLTATVKVTMKELDKLLE